MTAHQALAHQAPAHPAALRTGSTLEFLNFRLGGEEYGVDIQQVQELRAYTPVTRIANAPDFIKGVVNLRGIIVPIIDLRIKFALGEPSYDMFTVVIILDVAGSQVGVVVDSVSDVMTLTPDQVKPVPQVDTSGDAAYVIGMGALDERMIILVDMGVLLADAGITQMASLA
jgi:purine-binding chemotaxis protein CheW